jgi:hypothetical protein
MSAALNSVIIFRRQNGDILWQRHLKLVYFIVKSSWYNSQIKDFFKESRPRLNAALEWAPHLKLWKFKERRGAQTSKYGTDIAQHTPYQSFSVTGYILLFPQHTAHSHSSNFKHAILQHLDANWNKMKSKH